MAGLPARGYKWRDAWPGNDLAVTHGAFSPRIYGPEADAEFERLVTVIEAEDINYLKRPSFLFALEGLAEALGQVRVIRKHLATEHGTNKEGSDVEGCARETCWATAKDLENRVDRRLAALGLDASSRARIERDLGSAVRDRAGLLEGELAEGRRLRLAAEARTGSENCEASAGPAAESTVSTVAAP